MEKEKEEHTGGNTYINMTGGIFIKNIEHVEHLHAVPEKEEKGNENENRPKGGQEYRSIDSITASNDGLSVEDEEMLLPMFKGDRENLRQFFAEVQGAEPEQVVAKVNAWIGDGRIAKKFNMNKFWQVLSDMKIYPYSYKALNKHVMR